MWAKDRHHLILSLLADTDRLHLDRLVEETKVSRETLRRDIIALASSGKLKRVHGGVMRAPSGDEPPFASRMQANADAKRRIGVAVSRLIKPGMLCAIDAGSTTVALAGVLASVPGLSIITNSIGVAMALHEGKTDGKILLLGGRIASDVPGTYGELTIAEMRRFNIDLAIFSPVGLDARNGATSFHLEEAEFARAMIGQAARTVCLADHSKIGQTSRTQICACDDIDILVTDRKATRGGLAELRAKGVRDVTLA